MTRALVVFTILFLCLAAPLAAQTAAQVEAEPIVKLQPGATVVPGQCLTQQELDLIDGLNALRRPTVGVEGDDEGDDMAPFNPHYFVGTWEIEGVLPESPLGEAGEFLGTETIRHVEGCTYESTIEATAGDEAVTITSRLIYDRRFRYLVRMENDSRGYQLLKVGPVNGDSGGYSSHHWEAPAVTRHGSHVRLRGRTYMRSPSAYQVRMQMSVDHEPFANFGTVWWQRVDP
ncbi:MAG: hypothetical protein IH939_03810 [Acidobacteria bacterium]|nr:hypothetical protein [Acidobacteriota bacterium]